MQKLKLNGNSEALSKSQNCVLREPKIIPNQLQSSRFQCDMLYNKLVKMELWKFAKISLTEC